VTARLDWVLLAYRLPREPSTPRITVWRKLRRLGIVQIVDGLVALPADARTTEQLGWIAEEVLEAGGEATVWVGQPQSAGDERGLTTRMATAVADEYLAVVADAARARRAEDGPHRRTVARLQRELQRIGRRDFFPPPERHQAHAAVRHLTKTLEVAEP